ncbi:MAG: DHHA1 domain-containing protein [Candidatus Korarchaeota archaeon]
MNVIIAHNDCDGICAAAVVLSKIKHAKVIFTKPSNLALTLSNQPSNIEAYILDLAIDQAFVDDIYSQITRILGEGGKVTYIDHHPSSVSNEPPCESVIDITKSASQLAYEYFYSNSEPPILEAARIAVYGAIGDLFITDFVEKMFSYLDRHRVYLEAGILFAAIDGLERNDFDRMHDIVKLLAAGRSPVEADWLVTLAIRQAREEDFFSKRLEKTAQVYKKIAWVEESPIPLGRAAFLVASRKALPIGVAGKADNDVTNVSVRVRTYDIQINDVVSEISRKIGGIGGGHSYACGARIPQGKLREFVKMLGDALWPSEQE